MFLNLSFGPSLWPTLNLLHTYMINNTYNKTRCKEPENPRSKNSEERKKRSTVFLRKSMAAAKQENEEAWDCERQRRGVRLCRNVRGRGEAWDCERLCRNGCDWKYVRPCAFVRQWGWGLRRRGMSWNEGVRVRWGGRRKHWATAKMRETWTKLGI